MPTYLEWLIQIVAVVVISIWIHRIRHYVLTGLGISPQTVVTTMLWVVSLIVVVLSDASPAHLLWLFPLIFILFQVLIFVFPFTLLKIPADIFSWLCCMGIRAELTDSAANDPDSDKHLDENRLTGDWAYGAESEDGDDKRNGQGTHTLPDGTKYVGEFRDGKYNGQGTYTLPDGTKYVGEFRDGLGHGQGTNTLPDGTKYVGEWRDGHRNGQGTNTFPDGAKYVGEWRDGHRNGQGTNTFSDGEKYVGEWRDDNRHGQGTHTYADGRIMEGIWENGELGKSD